MRISYTVRIKAKNGTDAQLQDLVELCETKSPVGDTFKKNVSLELKPIIEKLLLGFNEKY
jgi:hypothetical protein